MAETPPPAISSRCPRCERTLRRDLDSSSPAALGRTCSSPLPPRSPPAVPPGALFRHKSDVHSPSAENLAALASRGPLFPAASPPPQFAGAGAVSTTESEVRGYRLGSSSSSSCASFYFLAFSVLSDSFEFVVLRISVCRR